MQARERGRAVVAGFDQSIRTDLFSQSEFYDENEIGIIYIPTKGETDRKFFAKIPRFSSALAAWGMGEEGGRRGGGKIPT